MLNIGQLLEMIQGYDDGVEIAIALQPNAVVPVGKVQMEYDIINDKDRIILVAVAPDVNK